VHDEQRFVPDSSRRSWDVRSSEGEASDPLRYERAGPTARAAFANVWRGQPVEHTW